LPSRSKALIDPRPPDGRELRDLPLRDPGFHRSWEKLGDRLVFTPVNSLSVAKPIAVDA
jgi:hypothetical protein